MQVASRLNEVWGPLTAQVNAPIAASTAFPLLIIAWSATEVVRYAYYAWSTVGRAPASLVYLRYTLLC